MRNIIIFLIALICTSCSRIVSTNYQLIDEGVVTETKNTPEPRVDVRNNTDSIVRSYHPKNTADGLSLWGVGYGKELIPGNKVYVYQDNEDIIITEISIEDAKTINQALSDRMWSDIKNWKFWLCFIIGFIIFIYYANKPSLIGASLSFVMTFIVLLVLVDVGQKLSLENTGKLTDIKTSVVTVDNSHIYVTSTTKDIFNNNKELKRGTDVFVYKYSDKHLISTKKINEATLKATQCYPEKFLTVLGIYILSFIVAFILILITALFSQTE